MRCLGANGTGCNAWRWFFCLWFAGCSVQQLSDEPRSSGAVPNPLLAGSVLRTDTADLFLPEAAQRALLKYGRALAEGQTEERVARSLPPLLSEIHAPLIAYVFAEDGHIKGSLRIDLPALSLRDKVAAVVAEMGPAIKDGYLHLMVVSYTARLPNFGIKGIFDNRVYEPQVTGIAYEWQGKRAEIDPIEALSKNLNSNNTRAVLAKRLGITLNQTTHLLDLGVEVYRVIHFGEAYPTRAFTSFFRGHRRLEAHEVTHSLLEERLSWIGEWYRQNTREGQVTYEYSVFQQVYREEKRTMVRSTMATWSLNRLAQYLQDAVLDSLAQTVIDYYLNDYFQLARIRPSDPLTLRKTRLPSGDLVKNRYTTASFLALTLLERPDCTRTLPLVETLMHFAMSYKRPNGHIWTPFGQQQYFEPGQLLLAVAHAYGKTGQDRYRLFFEQVYNFYEQALYASMHLGNDLYTPYAPAWFTQPAAQMHRLTGQDRYRNFVFAINDRLAKLYDLNAFGQVYYDHVGMLSPKRDYWGNTSITAAGLESLVEAALVAKAVGDTDRLHKYQFVIRQTVAYLLRLQYVPENTYHILHRHRVVGGFKKDLLDTTSWMDNVWHLTSAFVKIQQHQLLASYVE